MRHVLKLIVIVLVFSLFMNSLRNEEMQIVSNIIDTTVCENDEITPDTITPKRGKNAPTESTAETSSGASFGWYCKHMTDGERPPLPPEMSYIVDHGGYYLGEDKKVIYLTFDAGYENGNIKKILDTLKAENVPAAFFILEHLAEANTELVCRMFDEGHTVCNHTAVHKDMTKIGSFDAFKSELERMENCCFEKTGHSLSHYYRPPEGKVSEESLDWAEELGYKTIMWSYAYADWDNNNQMSEEAAIEKVISGTHNGEVLLLHPTSETNAKILPVLIQKWREMGYRFGTLDELTGDGDVS